jgi:hypothetical protein
MDLGFIHQNNNKLGVSYDLIAVFGKIQDFGRNDKLLNIEFICSGLS